MNLFFREEGEGFPIVIVHGLYGSSDNWLTVGKKLGAAYKVFMIDQRNHGRSPNSDEHSYEAMKTDLADFFDQQNIEKAILMGHSMGGKTAMCFAADYPERIEKLIVVDIAPKDYFLLNDESQYYLHNNILRAMLELDFSRVESRKQVENFLNERIDSTQIVQFLLKNVHRNKENHQYEWLLNVPVLYDNLDEIIKGVNAHWFDDRLPIKNYPVLFIKGADSNYILPEDYPTIRRIYPEAEIAEIPHAGHWLHAEQPQLFMETLLSFLKKK
jgi:pimeloyl-ACP methyl ester carboxylesterase